MCVRSFAREAAAAASQPSPMLSASRIVYIWTRTVSLQPTLYCIYTTHTHTFVKLFFSVRTCLLGARDIARRRRPRSRYSTYKCVCRRARGEASFSRDLPLLSLVYFYIYIYICIYKSHLCSVTLFPLSLSLVAYIHSFIWFSREKKNFTSHAYKYIYLRQI